ncbi:carbohydrate ABC transporter permease [Breznakiella homolactica]|uniref:Carbohydrate ABC transporter permease n=1 Tax=Breznakiella homolactica TaxID=2798577 RepID=A0A7T7XK11_9SPIR|nr:carbohydrate ABC transporter permease [Breznakiella homolactica]QQO07829.1 carbohydrate ABC transporter permease [Breznakiella homolactica]
MAKKPIQYLYSIIVFIIAFIWLVPFYWMLRSAFMGMEQIFSYPPVVFPNPIHWENLPNALTSLPFKDYFKNTFLIVAVCVTGILCSCSLSAYGFSRVQWKHRDKIFYILMSSIMLPYFATLIPNFILWTKLGLINTFVPLMLPSWFGMGTASIFGGGMFNIFLLRQFFRTIPKELDEAAFVDGAGHFTIFLKIVLPLSKPALISVGLFTFLNTWNDFINPLIFLSNERKYTIQMGLRTFIGMYTSQWNLLMMASLVAVVPVLLVFLIGQRYFVEGIATTGLKG